MVCGNRILVSETIPGLSNGGEPTSLCHVEQILAGYGQTRLRWGSGEAECFLCEKWMETSLSASEQSLAIMCACVCM